MEALSQVGQRDDDADIRSLLNGHATDQSIPVMRGIIDNNRLAGAELILKTLMSHTMIHFAPERETAFEVAKKLMEREGIAAPFSCAKDVNLAT